MTDRPWPAGAATGIGSLPGADIAEALRVVLGELPDLPHLPELPHRGPGSELIGRSAGLLVDLPVELYVGRWRVAGARGVDARRTADLLERDLDELASQASDLAGTFKVQCAGPWTLAAGVDLAVGGRLLRDPGAVRDLTGSLAEGLTNHLAQVQTRLPNAKLLLQLDEPSLPAVLAGHIPTESGFSVLGAIDAGSAATALREVIDKVGVPVVVHCCAPDAPIALLQRAGVAAIGLDLALVKDLDPLGEAIDSGLGLFAGAAPAAATRISRPAEDPDVEIPDEDLLSVAVANRVRQLWHQLGFPTAQLPAQVVVTPACGLADSSPGRVRDVLKACRDAGRRLADEAEG